MLDVGTIPVLSDSLTFGKTILTSLALSKRLSFLDATPIIFILNLFAYLNKLFSSAVLPEYEKIISDTADQIENFLEKTGETSKIQ